MTYHEEAQLPTGAREELSEPGQHGIAFEEAARVFDAPERCVEIFDEPHSSDEERLIAIGPVRRGLVLVVWTEREDSARRIISARWATRSERRLSRRHMESQR
jgi:uncharacterized protein